MEEAVLHAAAASGARDGISGEAAPTVDGLSLEVNLNIVRELNGILEQEEEEEEDDEGEEGEEGGSRE